MFLVEDEEKNRVDYSGETLTFSVLLGISLFLF